MRRESEGFGKAFPWGDGGSAEIVFKGSDKGCGLFGWRASARSTGRNGEATASGLDRVAGKADDLHRARRDIQNGQSFFVG